MSLIGAITRLQSHAGSLPDIKSAPITPPDGMAGYPFSVAYPARGRASVSAGQGKYLHTIIIEFHCSRILLPRAVELGIQLIDQYYNLILQDVTLGGEIDTMQVDDENPISYEFGRLEWGGMETIGVRFSITVKLRENFT